MGLPTRAAPSKRSTRPQLHPAGMPRAHHDEVSDRRGLISTGQAVRGRRSAVCTSTLTTCVLEKQLGAADRRTLSGHASCRCQRERHGKRCARHASQGLIVSYSRSVHSYAWSRARPSAPARHTRRCEEGVTERLLNKQNSRMKRKTPSQVSFVFRKKRADWRGLLPCLSR